MKESFLLRAEENFKAAELLYENELFNASVNRAYYSAFHLSIALLFDRGFTPAIDHRNTLSMFCNEFINKKKLFPSEIKKIFYELQTARNKADYGEGVNKNTANNRLKNLKVFFATILKELDYEN